MQRASSQLGLAFLTSLLAACSGDPAGGSTIGGGGSGNAGGAGAGGPGGAGGNGPSAGGTIGYIDFGDAGVCQRQTCASLGWECGSVEMCGEVVDCADEGLACGAGEGCVGGIDGPTRCTATTDPSCALCNEVPDCSDAAQPTRLTGRVITPGQNDANTANQVGVPNAVVYIMRTDQIGDLPPIGVGVPSDGESCDRCEDQDLGPLLSGAITDALGNFTIEGNVPVGAEFLLVVKAGKFRRVVPYTVPEDKACQTEALPITMSTEGGELAGQGLLDNPTRLPRDLGDGLAVNIPRIAVSTGAIDAMECVFYKMGLAEGMFGNFEANATHRVDLYRGSASGAPEGASIDGSTPHDEDLYDDLGRLEAYDMVVSDCEGGNWDSSFAQRGNGDDNSQGGKVRQYVNRGGRMFLSHLSFSWLHQNGTAEYDPTSAATVRATGLGPSSTWFTGANTNQIGTGVVSLIGDRPRVTPRIQTFADWAVQEAITTAPDYTFTITDPRSQNESIAEGTEEFAYRADAPPATQDDDYSPSGNGRVQQFSFNTPFGAPDDAICGRVAYSGFHVAATSGQGTTPYSSAVFPAHCTSPTLGNGGNLTAQEKILLFMLFDLGACVGDTPLPPPCVPITCDGSGIQRCGFTPDGCGSVLDCGVCRPPA